MNRINKRLLIAIGVIGLFLVIGTFFFHAVEGWSFLDSFYMAGITLTTVGYGDLSPTHPISKIFSVLLAFSGIGLVFYSVSILAQHYFQSEVERAGHRFLHNTESIIRKEEKQVEKVWHDTIGAIKKEEKDVENFFKKVGIRDMQKKGKH